MSENNNNNQNLTVWQKLTHAFGPNSLLGQDYPVFKYDKKELLKTTNKQEYEKAKLQAQQTAFLSGQWGKVENNLYTQGVYFEPTRLASYYDYESMEYSISSETKIATPDGFITIKELADKGRDHEFITYAYDHNLKKVVPAKARNAHYTRDEMTYKITFDDNSYIIATYGHRFLKRDGVFCKVEDLQIGDSMMPFYRKSFYNNQKYNWVYTCNPEEGHNGWVSEHNLIAEWFYETKVNEDEEVHHIDFNGKRKSINNPAYINLPFEKIIDAAKNYKTIRNTAKSLGVSYRKLQNDLVYNGFKNWFDFLDVYKIEKSNLDRRGNKNNNFKKIPWDLLIEIAKRENSITNTAKLLNVSKSKILRTIREGGFDNWLTFVESYGIEKSNHHHPKNIIKENETVLVNHKIISIEPYGVVPVYDLTVPGYKNFATDTIFSHNTPEISAALDIYAEESTTPDQNGNMLQIYSESNRIKSVLEDLFYNNMDINTNLAMWTRNTCKFGDNFVYLKLDPERGVVGCMQLPNIEIERIERGMKGKSTLDKNESEQKALRFSWKNRDMDFNTWEIAHFRLLSDDRKLPYGTSMLEKARRIWKQLLLSEDAMLIYRTSRAPERRIFKVFVGNMDDKDVEPYVQRFANKFKRDQVVDNKTGNVDLRFNQMAVDQDYFVPVRDMAQPDPITTLAGAQNLSEIADIEYIQKKLLTALRVPKAFLGFEEALGDGKNLSLMDIRFARTINRIQKGMLGELNKIAIIHLFLLGFEDELGNFSLKLTNPSTQADLLKLDVWKEKIAVYKDAVTVIQNIAPVSVTFAKKHILGMSDEEIKLDLQQQRLEVAVGAELVATPTIISKTGIFNNIDKLYASPSGTTGAAPATPESGVEGIGSLPSLGGPEEAPETLGGTPPPAPPAGGPEEGGGITPESINKDNLNILLENEEAFGQDTFIDLSKGKNSLGEIETALDKLLNREYL